MTLNDRLNKLEQHDVVVVTGIGNSKNNTIEGTLWKVGQDYIELMYGVKEKGLIGEEYLVINLNHVVSINHAFSCDTCERE